MTKQIGRAYRRNRKSSWLLAVFVAIIAVAAMPIANGNGTLPPLTGTIGGKVWQDTNENKQIDGAALEPGLSGVEVNLFVKTPGFLQKFGINGYAWVKATTTAGDGTYSFNNILFGPSYLVCEHFLTDTGKWSQTTPDSGQTKPCGTIPINKPNGIPFAFKVAADGTGKNFGNVQSVPLTPEQGCGTGNFSGASVSAGFEYEAKLTLPPNTCKTGSLVMLTYQDGTTRVATLHPPIGVSGTKYPVVERFKWTGLGSGQNPITLKYNDNPPYDAAGSHVMLMCNSDPRSPAGSGYTLGANPELVLPSGETSCMIVSTESAGGTYEAYVYSSVDGWKGGG